MPNVPSRFADIDSINITTTSTMFFLFINNVDIIFLLFMKDGDYMAIACITGASSGIGMEFAKRLSRMNYELILVSRNTKVLENMAKKLPCKCEIITCNLADEVSCKKLADYLKTKKLTLLINNAGFGDWGLFDTTDLDKDLDMINVNIKALHILTKELLQDFKKRNYGYILNVASSAGLLDGGPYMASYYATKAYVTSLTSSIYEELREANSNVHISMLCPDPAPVPYAIRWLHPPRRKYRSCYIVLRSQKAFHPYHSAFSPWH